MKIIDISFDEKFKLYSIQKSLKAYYETGYCGGIYDTSGHFTYDFINETEPIIIDIELKKQLWIKAKQIFAEKFKTRQSETKILHEIFKTLLCQHELERLKELGIIVELKLEKE